MAAIFGGLGLGGRGKRGWLGAIVSLMLICAPIAAACAPSASDPTVQPHVRALYEAFMRRALTDEEWRQALTAESAAGAAYSEQAIAELDFITGVLRGEDSKASALHQRFRITSAVVFNAEMVNTLAAKMLLTLDPVAVIDMPNKRLMTLASVRAIMGIHKFATTGADPRGIELPSAEHAVKLSATLREAVLKGGVLPDLHCEAAVFWAGITQEWPRLSDAEKAAARDFAKQSLSNGAATLPDNLYIKLAGWSQDELNARKLAAASGQLMTSALGWSYNQMTGNMAHQSLMIGMTIQNFMLPPPPQ